jgi:cell division protein FtsW
MMFVGRVPKHQLLKTMGVGAIIGIVGFAAIMSAPESIKSTRFGSKVITWQHRFEGALRPRPVTAEEYDMNENEQRTYSHIAIASSHIIGRGPGNSIQRDFIPHAYSDYIFAVIIEELGLLGATFVILLYLTLLYTCGKIAKKCDDPYMAFLSIGTGMMITTQALLHMFISVSNFVTGQPLPLMSQGGTSFLINCIYIGLLLCISRYVSTPSDKVTSEPQSV